MTNDRLCPIIEDERRCNEVAVKGGMCNKHWTRYTRHGDPAISKLIRGNDEARFLQKINQNGPLACNHPEFGRCWIWLAYRSPVDGRGRFGIGSVVHLAHRWAYEHWIGPIPDGFQLDHFACDNGAGGCVNPWHVRPTTPRENTLRSNAISARYLARTHCGRGHEFTPENTRIGSKGERVCIACRAENRRAAGIKEARRATETHCANGHPWDSETERFDSNGKRRCRACKNESRRKS